MEKIILRTWFKFAICAMYIVSIAPIVLRDLLEKRMNLINYKQIEYFEMYEKNISKFFK